jgi:excinuclease UvrABC nuclease subunit
MTLETSLVWDGEGPDPVTASLSNLPAAPGIYLFWGGEGDLLYIGKSVNLRDRVRSYFYRGGGHTRRTERLKHEVRRLEIQQTGSELEALLIESRTIKAYQPRYNVRGRRYEHFPFVKVTHEPYPRVLVTRVLEEDGGQYFGPFLSRNLLEEALEALLPLYGIRSCNVLPAQSCLQLAMGRCIGPCLGNVELTYADAVQELMRVLRGEADEVVAALKRQMAAASESHEYERAARLRDRAYAVHRMAAHQVRMKGALDGLDVLVVLPGYPVGTVTILAIRRARWAGALSFSADELSLASRRLRRQLRDWFIATPAPAARISPQELDEVQIVGTWLYRNRERPGVFSVDPADPEGVARAAIAHARSIV